MRVPQSAPGDVRREVVLIALRSLSGGKGRLADALGLEERNHLIRSMARNVITAAHDLDVLVVHDDPEVEIWAKGLGAETLRQRQPGLNVAITEGRDHLYRQGVDRVIVAHADLPQATDLRIMCTGRDIVIAPDRHLDGTNVLAVPTAADFEFAYGPGSFDRHVAMARQLGIEPHIVSDPGLAWDVDTPSDLDYRATTDTQQISTEETREGNH